MIFWLLWVFQNNFQVDLTKINFSNTQFRLLQVTHSSWKYSLKLLCVKYWRHKDPNPDLMISEISIRKLICQRQWSKNSRSNDRRLPTRNENRSDFQNPSWVFLIKGYYRGSNADPFTRNVFEASLRNDEEIFRLTVPDWNCFRNTNRFDPFLLFSSRRVIRMRCRLPKFSFYIRSRVFRTAGRWFKARKVWMDQDHIWILISFPMNVDEWYMGGEWTEERMQRRLYTANGLDIQTAE